MLSKSTQLISSNVWWSVYLELLVHQRGTGATWTYQVTTPQSSHFDKLHDDI